MLPQTLQEPGGRRHRTPPDRTGRRRATSRPPPPRVHGVAHDEIAGRGVGRQTREQAHGQVKRTPPHVHGCRTASIGSPEGGQDQGRLGRRREVPRNLVGVVAGVVQVLVERHLPGDLLGGQVDLHRPAQAADASRALHRVTAPTDRLGAKATRSAPPPLCSITASCARRSSTMTSDPEPSGAGGAVSQPPRAQAQRGMLQLWLGRSEPRRQFAKYLAVPVQCVACLAPLFVRSRGPPRHAPSVANGTQGLNGDGPFALFSHQYGHLLSRANMIGRRVSAA